ncbi:MAG: hypothetical protein RLZZ455_1117 [Candidatus Parcubacteria bacterium]|jgi:glycosyltransferase involved in cell wall biosynthesis
MNQFFSERLRDKKVVIVTQQGTTGPSHDIRDLFVPYVDVLLFIGHPLLFLPENFKKGSMWELYKRGAKKSEGHSRVWRANEFVLYGKDFLYSFFWFFSLIRRADIFIGVGNINAFAGIFLQKIGLVRRTIFYCIDYVPVRFQNKIINSLYHAIDRFVVENSDVVWNLSPRMIEGRRGKWGSLNGNQIVVPIGIWYDRIVSNRSIKMNTKEIIYLGTLLEKQGLDMCIEAISDLVKTIPGIRLTIIGSGPYEKALKEKVKLFKLEHCVIFEGYIKSHLDVERRISQSALALAMYDREKDTFSYYADPGKVKVYLACGVPVLITDVPYIARLIQEKKCGFLTEYNRIALVETISSYLKTPHLVKSYKQNALQFAKRYNWPDVIEKALKESHLSL